MIGLGEPREVRAGVVDGSYFAVVGLHPVLGRLIGPQDDGPKADGVVVLTYRFWSTTFKSDPSVIGKTVRLAAASAIDLPPSSASSNPLSPIPRIPKSLPTLSPAPIICPRPCRTGADHMHAKTGAN